MLPHPLFEPRPTTFAPMARPCLCQLSPEAMAAFTANATPEAKEAAAVILASVRDLIDSVLFHDARAQR